MECQLHQLQIYYEISAVPVSSKEQVSEGLGETILNLTELRLNRGESLRSLVPLVLFTSTKRSFRFYVNCFFLSHGIFLQNRNFMFENSFQELSNIFRIREISRSIHKLPFQETTMFKLTLLGYKPCIHSTLTLTIR